MKVPTDVVNLTAAHVGRQLRTGADELPAIQRLDSRNYILLKLIGRDPESAAHWPLLGQRQPRQSTQICVSKCSRLSAGSSGAYRSRSNANIIINRETNPYLPAIST